MFVRSPGIKITELIIYRIGLIGKAMEGFEFNSASSEEVGGLASMSSCNRAIDSTDVRDDACH